MTSLFLLMVGVMVLFGTGVPTLRRLRANARDQHDIEARLLALQSPLDESGEPIRYAAAPGGAWAGGPRFIRVLLSRADVELRPAVLLPVFAAVVGACAIGGLVFGWVYAGAALAGIVVVAVYGFVRLAKMRLAKLIEGLPVLLDSTRQLLVIGNSLQQALVKAANDAEPGVQRYLGRLLRRVQNGASVPDGLGWLAEQLDVPEMHMFATAVQTNNRYGGRVSTVLQNLTQILRDRGRVERELRASTSETRASALVLCLLPVAMAVMISFVNRSYVTFFINTSAGNRMIMVACGLEVLGILLMRRIMRLDP